MINCLVLDDEQHAIDLLTSYIQQVPFLNLTHSTTSPIEALSILGQKKIDLIFSDMQMPEISGIDFVRAINGKYQVIFTTAHGEFAVAGYEHDVIDFLLKPITFPRFLKSVQKAQNIILAAQQTTSAHSEEGFMFIKTELKGKMVKVDFKDIDYVEGMKNYVAIYKGENRIMALMNMKYLEETLPAPRFVRIHNSYIVAIDRISAIEGNQVMLKNVPGKIPIGVTYRDNFLKRLNVK